MAYFFRTLPFWHTVIDTLLEVQVRKSDVSPEFGRLSLFIMCVGQAWRPGCTRENSLGTVASHMAGEEALMVKQL